MLNHKETAVGNPHKWAKEIKAWADGAEIEQRWHGENKWEVDTIPVWNSCDRDFRIKPQPKEPQYLYVYKSIPDNYGNGTTEVKISTVKVNNKYYLGKIKLETDDD